MTTQISATKAIAEAYLLTIQKVTENTSVSQQINLNCGEQPCTRCKKISQQLYQNRCDVDKNLNCTQDFILKQSILFVGGIALAYYSKTYFASYIWQYILKKDTGLDHPNSLHHLIPSLLETMY
jgi:hypothetical protein